MSEKAAAEVTTTPPVVETPATPPQAEALKTDPPKVNEGDPAKAATEKPVEPQEPPKAEPKPPEKYELKSRKDSPLLKSDLEEIETAAKAKGLSQEDAQRMVEGREADHDRFFQRQQDQAKSQMAQWRKDAESDKEIAGVDGKAFAENVELAHRGLKMFADDSFSKTLAETGLGNHPQLIKTFMRIGKRFANDKAVLDVKASPTGKRASREEKLFPSHSKKE